MRYVYIFLKINYINQELFVSERFAPYYLKYIMYNEEV